MFYWVNRTVFGIVYEQAMTVRRITIELVNPRRDGDREVHILTDLPEDICDSVISNLYRHRWEEETALHVLQMTLTCELSSISHFHISKNISDNTDGMLIAITEDERRAFIPSSVRGLVAGMKDIARTIDLKELRKSRRGPKKPTPKRLGNVTANDLYTAKLSRLTLPPLQR